MTYYTATRTQLQSPVYTYFDSIEAINTYYGIDSKEEDYKGCYAFPYKDTCLLLGYNE